MQIPIKSFKDKTDVFIVLNGGNSVTIGADIKINDDECYILINEHQVCTDGFVYFATKEELEEEFKNWSTCDAHYFDIDEKHILMLKDFQGEIYLDFVDSSYKSLDISLDKLNLKDYILHQSDIFYNLEEDNYNLKVVINHPIMSLSKMKLIEMFEHIL